MQVMRLLGFLHNYCFIEKCMCKAPTLLNGQVCIKADFVSICLFLVNLRSILVQKSCWDNFSIVCLAQVYIKILEKDYHL